MIDSIDYSDMSKDDDNLTVTGGRDDSLLELLARRMDFKVMYVDPPERTQGNAIGNSLDGFNFTGGIGMIQRREADLFLGDIPLSWDRRQAVEFSFFTLADSGAFVTHSSRKLSKVLVLIRPFSWNVWPVLLFTVIITAPALYVIIMLPYKWHDRFDVFMIKKSVTPVTTTTSTSSCSTTSSLLFIESRYLNEITYGHRMPRSVGLIQYKGIPKRMFNSISWFVVNLYLKQSIEFKFTGHRVRFLVVMIWLGATYVLGDMYSAQLTSQLARPAKEKAISKSKY